MKVAIAARNRSQERSRGGIERTVVPTTPMAANLCECPTVLPPNPLKFVELRFGRSIPFARIRKRLVNRSGPSAFELLTVNQDKCSCSRRGQRLTITLRMARNRTSSRWAAIALAVTLVLFFVSSVGSSHSHDGVSGRGCDLCHTAKLPALCFPVGPTVVLPAHADWHFPLVVFFRVLESDHLSGPSRAPPLS
jgi:hypothetical protein